MPVIESPSESVIDPRPSSFEPEALAVIQFLGLSIASALADIGEFGKPADVHKILQLDRTLSRQLFRLASSTESIGNGGIIPSRTSIDRFLNAARSRGAHETKLKGVLDAYRMFEKLIETHAGDRATFNSMVSAASGIDEDWLAADLQHRRNAFRAMSHALGVQLKTKIVTTVIAENGQDGFCDLISLLGIVGFRVLRALPSVRVFGSMRPASSKQSIEPLHLNGSDNFLLEQFSTSPLPKLMDRSGTNEIGTYHEISVEKPPVGNVGSSTLTFGHRDRQVPFATPENRRLFVTTNLPVETLLFDFLIAPALFVGAKPKAKAFMNFRGSLDGPDVISLQGNFNVEFLGKGPRVLATPEIPKYVELLQAISEESQLQTKDFYAWRVRVEFPLYQSTISVFW